MKGILLSLLLVLCYLHNIQGSWNSESFHRYFIQRQWENYCKQETPNCNQCLAKSGCSWCGKDGIFECSPEQSCSQQARQYTCPPNPQNEFLEAYSREISSPRNAVVFGVNTCSARKNCSDCTSEGYCAWCAKTTTCLPHYNMTTTTEACGSNLWYKDQCLYSSTVKPCPERTSGCKECTADSVCYWCKATGNCSYFPHDAYIPDNCPKDSWYYESCSRMELIVVLAPILCILFLPVLIFIVLALILCCMKRLDYKGTNDPDKPKYEHKSPPEEKKPFMMNHKTPQSKIDALRKKYNLEDKP